MELIDFVKRSKRRAKCCGRETPVSEISRNNESFSFDGWKIGDNPTFTSAETDAIGNERSEKSVKFLNGSSVIRKDHKQRIPLSEVTYSEYERVDDYLQEETSFSPNLIKTAKNEFRCPRCGRRMHEPKLLPCLHPICSPCVYELINTDKRTTQILKERCPLCDFPFPSKDLNALPPHYPLQHRLVMDAVRYKLAYRVLCDNCHEEILASVQCSICLKNFCQDCGTEHQESNFLKHIVKPLWKATKIRRTLLCPKHNHALKFYCIACQQITCKECVWSYEHRGHATESAITVGKRISVHLTAILQRAKTILNSLLTQYNKDVFACEMLENHKKGLSEYW